MTSGLDDIASALKALATAFVASETRYFIGGSLASSMQGEFRATNHIDVVCNLLPKTFDRFLAALGDQFLVDHVALRSAVERGTTFNIIHEPSFIKIDLFFARSEFQLLELERAILVELSGFGLSLYVATPEDIILAKLNWYKKGGETSERQWADIRGVMRTQGARLDYSYLAHWAEKLNVHELLNRMLQERHSA